MVEGREEMKEDTLILIQHALSLILEKQRMDEYNRLLPLALKCGSGSDASKELERSWNEYTAVIDALMAEVKK